MHQASKRARKVADLIKREVALLMKTEVSDPRLENVVITTVDISPDLSNAKVYFTLTNTAEPKEANAAFKKAAGFIRHAISEKTELRYTPKISFVYDDTTARANKLIDLIDGAQLDA